MLSQKIFDISAGCARATCSSRTDPVPIPFAKDASWRRDRGYQAPSTNVWYCDPCSPTATAKLQWVLCHDRPEHESKLTSQPSKFGMTGWGAGLPVPAVMSPLPSRGCTAFAALVTRIAQDWGCAAVLLQSPQSDEASEQSAKPPW